MTRSSPLFVIPLVAACYVYHPVPGSAAPTTDEVRMALTDAGTADLAAQLGPSIVEVTGRLVSNSADAYVVSLLGTRTRGGIEATWRGERVTVQRSLVSRLDERRFSRTRTALLGFGTIVAALVAREAFWGPGGVFGGSPPGPGPGPR